MDVEITHTTKRGRRAHQEQRAIGDRPASFLYGVAEVKSLLRELVLEHADKLGGVKVTASCDANANTVFAIESRLGRTTIGMLPTMNRDVVEHVAADEHALLGPLAVRMV